MRAGIEVGDFTALPLGQRDLASLHRLCLRSSEFYELIGDEFASETAAAEILGPLEAPYLEGTKYVFGMSASGELFAVAELLQGHPSASEWYIGLLLVDPAHRRKGVGRQLASAIIDWIAAGGGARVRLVVQQQNPGAFAFWKRLGFQVEYETVTLVGQRSSAVRVLVLHLPVA